MKITHFVKDLPFLKASLFLCMVHLALLTPAVYGEVLIVASKNVNVDSISAKDLQNIFMGHKTKLSDQTRVSFVLQEYGEIHTEFVKTYMKRTTNQFDTYWCEMLFSGKGRIPATFENEKELIEYVASNEGVISYVSKAPDDNNVKIIRVE